MALPIVVTMARRYGVAVAIADAIWKSIPHTDYRDAVSAFEMKLQARQQFDPVSMDIQSRLTSTAAVCLSIPLLIRVMEYVREDIKTDTDLHVLVEALMDASGSSSEPLTMTNFPDIVGGIGAHHG